MFLVPKNLLSDTRKGQSSAVWQGLSRPLIHDQDRGLCTPLLNQPRINGFAR